MPDRFARCLNADYCSLGDRRLVMRLADNEALICPECAHSLVPAAPWGKRRIPWPALGAIAMGGAAIAAGFLVAQRWPHAASYLAPHAFKLHVASAPPITPLPSIIDEITGAVRPAVPDPDRLFLATTMDAYLSRRAGDFVLRGRRMRPPRIDPEAVQAGAALEAGVPPVPWPEEFESGDSMPWRQALIMAALVTPGQPLGAGRPPPVQAADAPGLEEIQTQPLAGAPPVQAAPDSASPAPATPKSRQVIRPQTSLPVPMHQTTAEQNAQLALANSTMQDSMAMQSDLASLIVPVQGANAQQIQMAAKAATLDPEASIPPILRAPVAPPAIVTPEQSRLASTPDHIRDAKSPEHKPATRVATAHKPMQKLEFARDVQAARHAGKSHPTPAPVAVAAGPPEPSAAPAADEAAADAPASRNKIMAMPSNLRVSYGPLKDVHLADTPTRSIFLPSRPTSDKPQTGHLKVDCAIETSGVPADCRVLTAERAAAVSDALLAWLGSGLVHYPPKTEEGHPVRSRRTLTLDFPVEALR